MTDLAGPSETARRVAAFRLGFEREAAEGESPEDDDRLAADVAAGVIVDRSSRMARYLGARTRFFDRVVVNAVSRHVSQIVVIGAGYDGRALRYRAPGVRWFEVDRERTQRDKLARVERLGISTDGVAYIALDLANGGLATALLASGFEPDAPSLFLVEGVAPYLDAETLRDVMGDLRSLATPGTRLAISLGRWGTDTAAREQFEAAVAALGEVAVGTMSGDDATSLLVERGWRPVEVSERAAAVGLAKFAPTFTPAPDGGPATVGKIGRFIERTLARSGEETLAAHLEEVYGVPVADVKELDHGVHRVRRADGLTWVARVFPASRSAEAVRNDALLLAWLRESGIPAERPADRDPVSVHEGQPVLVTDFVPGREPPANPDVLERLGVILGQIHALPVDAPPANRPGGAWHHMACDVSESDELSAVASLMDDARHRVPPGGAPDYERLWEALDVAKVPLGLPTGVVHPDFVPRNVLQREDGSFTVIDWSGAGRGVRVVSLGSLLWSVAGDGPAVAAAARGYSSRVRLESAEIDHLAEAMAVRPAVLACWTFAIGRASVADAAKWWAKEQHRISRAAERASAQLLGASPGRRSLRGSGARDEAQARQSISSTAVDAVASEQPMSPAPSTSGAPSDVSAKKGAPRTTRRDSSRTNNVVTAPPTTASASLEGEFVREVLDYDGGRRVTVYVPPAPPEAIVFAGDGELIAQWGEKLEAVDIPPTMIVGVHGRDDETLRLHEYSPSFDPVRFAAHEEFFTGDVRRWVRSRFGVALPAKRTAVCGVSASGELALALGLRHADLYGVVFCASPGGGYRPPDEMPTSLPRTYLVAGTREPFFQQNTERWATALRDAGGDVVLSHRNGTHGGPFWREEFPLMVKWAFFP